MWILAHGGEHHGISKFEKVMWGDRDETQDWGALALSLENISL